MSFLRFLTTGQLEQLNLGMTLDHVIEYLGFPFGIHTQSDFNLGLRKTKQSAQNIGVYGLSWEDLYLMFSMDDRLSCINLEGHHPNDMRLPAPLDSSWLPEAFSMSRQQFRQWIDQHGLTCYRLPVAPQFTVHVDRVWVADSRVGVTFTLEDGEDRIYTLEVCDSAQDMTNLSLW